MADFNYIHDRLATGAGLNDASDVDALVRSGANCIIDCRDDFDDAQLISQWMLANPHHNIRYLWNGTADDGTPKPPGWFHRSISFALVHGLALEHGVVYTHCAAGVNRGPSTAYAIMRACGWSPDAAEQAIRAVRPQVGLAYKANADTAYDFLYKRVAWNT